MEEKGKPENRIKVKGHGLSARNAGEALYAPGACDGARRKDGGRVPMRNKKLDERNEFPNASGATKLFAGGEIIWHSQRPSGGRLKGEL